jgi:hypothetical protein
MIQAATLLILLDFLSFNYDGNFHVIVAKVNKGTQLFFSRKT